MKQTLSILAAVVLLASCTSRDPLPILGNRVTETRVVDGKEVVDTIYQTVPDFKLINQDAETVTQELVKNNIYVADFFFTTCPTICPVMKREMIRVHEKFKQRPDIMMLSHTIDPEHDTVEVLKDYANRLGSDGKQWQFLTGNRDSIYDLAERGYYASAQVDSTEPGGFVHSGGFILVDKNRYVRGIYDGTDPKAVDRLIADIETLILEK